MEPQLVSDLAICIVAAWLMGVLAQVTRQPLLLAYLVAGFVIGPVGLGLVKRPEALQSVSEIGLILLLFLIGLEIDLKKILGTGKLVSITSISQILGCSVLGIAFFWLIGYPLKPANFDALYLGVAAALSSTVIIVKLLYEKRELDTLPGRLTLGVLVLQDLFAILFLAIQPNLDQAGAQLIFASILKVGLLIAITFLTSRYALPPLFTSIARLPELVLVGAMAWCLLIAGVAGSLHLSREMGALVAGISISTFPYTLDIEAKLTSLRDFFVTLFFVALGMAIPAPNKTYILGAIVLCTFVIVSRILTVFPLLHLLKQGFRASLLTSLNLAQISELSLVILALGVKSGHISAQSLGIVSYAFVFLGILSSYAIANGETILGATAPFLRRLGFTDLGDQPLPSTKPLKPRIFLLGFYWTASSLVEEISKHAPNILPELLVIDFNPDVNRELQKRGIQVIYGDITQRDTLIHAGITEAEIIICSIPNSVLRGSTNLKLLTQLRELNETAKILVHAELFPDVNALYKAGADYVSVPRLIEAQELCEVIHAIRSNLLQQKRADLDAELLDRNEVIP
jgi:Kef-type K+ transport system membrane component KefB